MFDPTSMFRRWLIPALLLTTSATYSQTIGTFTSVTPGAQSQSLVLPSTHTFQRLFRTGNALTAGGTLGADLDFTGYVPIAGSSRCKCGNCAKVSRMEPTANGRGSTHSAAPYSCAATSPAP